MMLRHVKLIGALALAACACATRTEPAPQPAPAPVVVAPAPAPVVEAPPPAPAAGALVLPGSNVISLEKTAPAEVNENATFAYSIRVTNISNMQLTDVTVTDHLPAEGYTYESSNPAGKLDGKTLTWNLGELGRGESRDITVNGKATQMGVITNCATVAYTPVLCVPTRVVAAGLEVTKSEPAEVLVCDDIPIRIVVTNPGTGRATNVRVVDDLPEGWTVEGRSTLSFDVGTLAGGESRELTARAHAAKTGKYVNKATATADGGLKKEASAETVVRQPVLEITKSASVKAQILGRETTFTITVKNTGDYAANNLTVTDSIAGADSIGSVSDGGMASGGTVTWNLGSLAPGAERTVTVRANRSTPGTIVDNATARAVCAEPVSAAAETVYRGIPAVLLEVVDDPDPVTVGNTTTYTITVTNQGTAVGTDIKIVCNIEDGVEFVSCGGATQGTASGGTITFGSLAELAPKAVATWTVVARGRKAADTRFKVMLTTRETERPIEETEATRFYE